MSSSTMKRLEALERATGTQPVRYVTYAELVEASYGQREIPDDASLHPKFEKLLADFPHPPGQGLVIVDTGCPPGTGAGHYTGEKPTEAPPHTVDAAAVAPPSSARYVTGATAFDGSLPLPDDPEAVAREVRRREDAARCAFKQAIRDAAASDPRR